MTTTTYCRICEAACGLEFEDGRVRPDRAHPVSRGFVCAKGTRFLEVAEHETRLRTPMVRRGARHEAARWEPVSWEAGIEAAAARIRPILERHGPHAVGIYLGNPLAFHALGQLTAFFFARALGTRNVFGAGSQDCHNKFAAAEILHGTPVIQPIPDFEHAELAVLFGTNPAVSQSSFVHLEGGASVFDRMVARGARVVWVDVRRTESAKRWGDLLTVRPGTDVWLLLAILGLVADRTPSNDDRVEGLEILLELARTVSPARAAAMTGVAADAITELAEAIANARGAALHMSVGVNMGPFGTLSYIALQAIAFVTGNYDARGGSLFSSAAMATAHLTRAAGLFQSRARSRIGDFPTVFETLPGGVLADEILTEGDERIRAMIVVAGDPLHSIPGGARLTQAFESLDALVCLDLFESRTGRYADVLLPSASWLERADFSLASLAVQTGDLLQTTGAVMPRVGDAHPDHETLAQLSSALGRPLFGSQLAARLLGQEGLVEGWIPHATDLAWRLLDGDPSRRGHGVPVPAARPGVYLGRGPHTPGHRVRFWHPSLDAERERLERWSAPKESFVLLGRRRRIGHNSWLHAGTRRGKPEDVAWMAPVDMGRMQLSDGASIDLIGAGGSLRLPVCAREGVAEGTVVVPHGEPGASVNEVLPAGPEHIEPVSGQLCMTGAGVVVRPVATASLDTATSSDTPAAARSDAAVP